MSHFILEPGKFFGTCARSLKPLPHQTIGGHNIFDNDSMDAVKGRWRIVQILVNVSNDAFACVGHTRALTSNLLVPKAAGASKS